MGIGGVGTSFHKFLVLGVSLSALNSAQRACLSHHLSGAFSLHFSFQVNKTTKKKALKMRTWVLKEQEVSDTLSCGVFNQRLCISGAPDPSVWRAQCLLSPVLMLQLQTLLLNKGGFLKDSSGNPQGFLWEWGMPWRGTRVLLPLCAPIYSAPKLNFWVGLGCPDISLGWRTQVCPTPGSILPSPLSSSLIRLFPCYIGWFLIMSLHYVASLTVHAGSMWSLLYSFGN